MTLTPRSTRTISGHVTQLLEYPRWVIERDVDFTHCPYDGRFDDNVGECADCKFGAACRWLNQDRTPTTDAASVEELVDALQTAVTYLQARVSHSRACNCDTCSWLHAARHFLHARSHWK